MTTTPSGAARPRILIVDDDSDFVTASQDLLASEGYDSLAAHDGNSGYELALREKPDLMLLDVMMTDNDEGIRICHRIKQTPELKSMPVILVTGARRALNLPFRFEPDPTCLPAAAVLEKPVMPETLLAAVRKLLPARPA